jgi:hypothetical protein
MLRFRLSATGQTIFPKLQSLKNWKNGTDSSHPSTTSGADYALRTSLALRTNLRTGCVPVPERMELDIIRVMSTGIGGSLCPENGGFLNTPKTAVQSAESWRESVHQPVRKTM